MRSVEGVMWWQWCGRICDGAFVEWDIDLVMPEWLRPPAEGYTAEDLDRLLDLPPHTELLCGSLVFSARQTLFHSEMVRRLDRQLGDQVPDMWEVWCRMGLRLDTRNRPEPDVMVVDSRACAGPDQTFWAPQDVLLVAEVVEEASAEWDRDVKPRKYADAGIRHFWRIELEHGQPVAHTYELDAASGGYVQSGTFRQRLTVRHPFLLDVTLSRPDAGREVSAPGTRE
ncbi:Uma2 family endonuclease [Kitasatospora sp. NPDC058162]|uniref:Uma2 family endonuclease n=1 Tax=Kitasatospora sp. NPDC058162 TaxID=3346362 RepID=UPI0036DBDAD0